MNDDRKMSSDVTDLADPGETQDHPELHYNDRISEMIPSLSDLPILTEKYLQTNYELRKLKSDNVLVGTQNYIVKSLKPSTLCFSSFLTNRLPILSWLPEYNFKESLFKDLIGGITVSCMI